MLSGVQTGDFRTPCAESFGIISGFLYLRALNFEKLSIMATNLNYGGPSARTFSEKENLCMFLYNEAIRKYGSFWHVCTPGQQQEAYNFNPEDYIFSINSLAISAFEAGVTIVTDAHMENHLHSLAGGSEDRCHMMMGLYIARLKRYNNKLGRAIDLSGIEKYKTIFVENLGMMRNEIAYINRNGYVDDPRFLPYSYPWGGGYLYYNPSARKIKGIPYMELPYREKRTLTWSRVKDLPEFFMVEDGLILPGSYVDYRLGESMFRDAHHYFSAITSNAEAYSAEAKALGDSVVLTRDEMYKVVKMIGKRDYNVETPSLLPPKAKVEVARILHGDYNASNAQIRMLLKMAASDVDTLFPLKALNNR